MNKKWVIVENAAMAFKAAKKQARRARHRYWRPRLSPLPMHHQLGAAAMLAQLLLTLFETVAAIEAPRPLIFGVDRQLEPVIVCLEVIEQSATQPV